MSALARATLTVDIESPGGWSLHLASLPGGTFRARLAGPSAPGGFELHFWRDLTRVYESLESHLRATGYGHVWTTLRASIEAELAS